MRNYFDKKGMHVQFNVIDRNTLLEAQKKPTAARTWWFALRAIARSSWYWRKKSG